MADQKPQNQEKLEVKLPASSTPQDYYAILMKVINDVTHDQAQLRKLVYALAWQNLKPEVIIAKPIQEAQSQAKNIFELEQALQLERAIERIEGDAVGRKQISRPRSADHPYNMPSPPTDHPGIFQPVDDFSPATLADRIAVPGLDPDPPVRAAQDLDAKAADAKGADAKTLEPKGLGPEGLDTKGLDTKGLDTKALDAETLAVQKLDASFEPPHAVNAVVPLPEQRSWPERKDVVHLERIPPWLDPNVRVSLDSVEYAPIHRPPQSRSHFTAFVQLIAASAIGVVLYIGISGWVYLGRHSIAPAPVSAPPQPVASAPGASDPASQTNQAQAPNARPAAEPQPLLPFPLPKNYGVFAGSPGRLVELEQLPIKVPDPRVLVSAEITKPSSVTTPGENLAFVVFRRDLINSAPQTVTVRVVARVQRTTKFVGGKPAIVPLEGIWRIRSKGYEFKVSPLEGRNEMVVIQPNPGFVFAPGRYALALNGFGYDFTVAGDVTATEQCLEQVEVVNGAVLSECPKT